MIEKLTDYSILVEKPYLNEKIGVLDHGVVELIDFNGSDKRIVDAARLSYQKGTKTVREDANLIDFLIRKKHMGPLEMCNITFYFEMPLFIVAQLVRHRTAKLNQESARYSVIEDKMFVPQDLRMQDEVNKQHTTGSLAEDLNQMGIQIIQMHNEGTYKTYEELIEMGVGRELARGVLPTATFTKLMWQSDLRNLFNFLNLRLDPHAQREIQEYANVMGHITSQLFPLAYNAFEEHILFGTEMSRSEMNILRGWFSYHPEAFDIFVMGCKEAGMRKSVMNEFLMKIFDRKAS